MTPPPLFLLLLDGVALIWLGLLAAASGDWMLDRLFSPKLPCGRRFLPANLLGWILFSYATMLLAVIHLLRFYAVFPALLVLTALFGGRLRQLLRLILSQIPRAGRAFLILPAWYKLMVGILFALLFCNLIRSHSPPTVDDELTYHLYPARAHAEAGDLNPPAIETPFYFYPRMVQMLYALAMLVRNDLTAKMLHCLFGVLLTLLLFEHVYRKYGVPTAVLAASILYSMPIFVTLSGLGYIDLIVAGWQLAAVLVFLQWRQALQDHAPSQKSWLALSAFFAGAAFAAKFTSLPLLVFLVLWGSWEILRAPSIKKISALGKLYGLYALCPLLLWMPWGIYSLHHTGNPLYPAPIGNLPSDPSFEAFLRSGVFPAWSLSVPFHYLWTFFTGTFAGAGGIFWGAGPLLGLAPLILLKGRNREDLHFLILGIANMILLATLFFYSPGNWKYALLTHALFSILAARTIQENLPASHLLRKVLQAQILLALLVPGLLQAAYTSLKRLPFQIGLQSRQEYLQRYYPYEGYDMIQFINRLPAEQRVGSFFGWGGGMPYYYEHPYEPIPTGTTGTWSWPEFKNYCLERHICLILFADFLHPRLSGGICPTARWLKPAQESRQLQVVYKNKSSTLYQLRHPSCRPASRDPILIEEQSK